MAKARIFTLSTNYELDTMRNTSIQYGYEFKHHELPYKPVKVQNVRARFRAESGFLDYDGVATNTMGLPNSIAMNVLPIEKNSGLTTMSTYLHAVRLIFN